MTTIKYTFTLNASYTGYRFYKINNVSNPPDIKLERGKIYEFNASNVVKDKSIYIATNNSGNNRYNTGITNSQTDRGGNVILFSVKKTAPSTLYYVCEGQTNSSGTIVIAPLKNPTITDFRIYDRPFVSINETFPITNPTSNSSGEFTYTIMSTNKTIVTISKTDSISSITILKAGGPIVVRATQSESPDDVYALGFIETPFTINKIIPTINGFISNVTRTFSYINELVNIPPPTDSNSSGAFTYSSSNNTIAIFVNTTNPTITILKTGSITVTVTQTPSSDGVYGIGTKTITFTINKIIPTINGFISNVTRTFSSINELVNIPPPTDSNSSGAFTYSSSNNTIATFVNTTIPTITILKAGSITVTVTQSPSSDGVYEIGTKTITFTINKATPTITNFTIPNRTFLRINETFDIIPPTYTNSSGVFTYTIPDSNHRSIATFVDTNIPTITILKAGDPITVKATQSPSSDGNYDTNFINTTFTINKATPIITGFTITDRTFLRINETFDIIPPTYTNSSGVFTYTIPDSNHRSIATFVNTTIPTITILKPGGPITVKATQSISPDGNYDTNFITTTFTINKIIPTITGFTITDRTFLRINETFDIIPPTYTNSSGAFTYSSSDSTIATFVNTTIPTITILKAGSITVKATQSISPDGNYDTNFINTTFTINKATPNITGFTITDRTFLRINETFDIIPPTYTNSSGAFTYTIPDSNHRSIATFVNTTIPTITILKPGGPITVKATQSISPDGNYDTNFITTTFTINKATPTITNFTIPNRIYLKGDSFTLNPLSDSSGNFTYTTLDASMVTVTNSTPSTISILKTGHVRISIAQSESPDGNYNSRTIDTSFNIVKATPTITGFSITNKTFSYINESFPITTPRSDSSGNFTYTTLDTDIADVSNNTITIKKAGHVRITATQSASLDGNYNSGFIDTSFNIFKATPTITNLTIPDRVYLKGDSFTLNPLSDSSGNFTYTTLDASMVTVTNSTPSTISILKTGHVRISIAQSESPDGNYNSRTIDTSFNIVKATPTITGFSITNKTFSYINESFPITTPQSDSSGNFTYTSLNTNIADVSNNILFIKKAGGPVTIRATQSASQDGNYNSGFIDTSLNIVKATPTISGFSIADRIFLRRNETFPITTPRSDSSGNFTYTSLNTDIADVFNNILTIKKAGSVRITATQSESLDGNYNSNSIDTSFNIIKATPTITNVTIPDRVYLKGDSFTLNPLSDSSGNFTYTTLDSSMATVTNSTPSTINVLKVGLVRITIAQAESLDGNYTSRSIDTSFNIVRATPTFGDFTIPNRVYLKGDFFALDLSSNSTGAISFTNTSNDTSIVDISNNTVHILKTGIVTITATQEQDDNYNSRSIDTSFNIVKANPTITNITIPNRIYLKYDSFTLDPSSNSSGNFTYTSSDESIVTVTNSTPSTVSILKAGHVRITLAQPASQDGNYNSRSIDTSFNIVRATPTLSNFIITDKNYFNGYNFDIKDPSSNSTGTFSYSSLNTNITIANTNPPTITILEAGHVVVTATQSADDNYNSQSIDTSFNILKISPTITNFTIPNRIYLKGDSFTLDQSSNSTGAFSYTTLDSSMVTITNSIPSTVSVLKSGHVRINLTQATDVNYISRSIDTSFNIIKATPIFGEFTITDKEYSNRYKFDIKKPSSNSTGTFTYSSLNTNITIANTTPPTITILRAGHVDITATQAFDDNYNSRSIDTSFNIFKVFPTITNFSILNQKYSYYGEKIPITDPSSNSIGKFSYTNSSLDTSIVDISGNEITILKSGNVTITATQASDDNYKSDTTVASFTIDPFAPTITNFTIPKQTFSVGHQFPITDPSSNSDGAFSYTLTSNDKIVDISGNQITILKTGEGTIEVTQQPTMNYTLGKSTAPLVIDKLLPTITNFTIPNRYYSPGYSDLPITDPSSNSTGKFNYISLNEDKAIVSGKYIFIKQAGEVTIKATQESSGNYLSNTVSTSFTIHQISPNIRNFTIPTLYYSLGGNFPITDPLSNNNNTFIYTIDNTNIADISNNNIIIKQAGETTITVKQESTINYEFQSITIVLKINKVSTNITNFTIPINNYLFGNNFDIIQPGTNRDGKFSYISSDDNIAYVYGNTIFIKNAGEVTVTALQTETDNYTEGRATALLRIPKLYPTITNFTIPTNTYKIGDTIQITDPSSNSAGAFSYSSSNREIATISDKIITILQEESVVITVTQAATNNYTAGTAIAIIIIETPIIPEPPVKKVYLGSLFTDNALVYYKSHILSSVGTGTVRNSKVKSKKI